MTPARPPGRGIGYQLMAALLDIADNDIGLVRVELLVYPGNEGAVHLYERFGFACEGVKRKGARRQGRLVDAVMMARIRGDGDTRLVPPLSRPRQ
jgi:putative acetyltransferase